MAEINITKENFDFEVLKADKTVLVDFWATWCAPCLMVAPIVSEIAEEFSKTVKVCKVNVDEEPELAAAFKISSIPTLVVLKNGEVINILVGYRPKEEIVALLK